MKILPPGKRRLYFGETAPVGNSNHYLNLRRLTAGGLLSLKENNVLLDTFFAF